MCLTGVLGNWSNKTLRTAKELYKNILSSPDKVIDYTLKSGEACSGFVKNVGGKQIGVFIYKTGEFAGKIATSFVLTPTQIDNLGL